MRKKIVETKEYTYTAMYEAAKEGGYTVIVPSLAGLVTYGRTFEEAREMVRDAIRCHLGAMKKDRVEMLKGLGKEVWRSFGGADSYIKKERASWEVKSKR